MEGKIKYMSIGQALLAMLVMLLGAFILSGIISVVSPLIFPSISQVDAAMLSMPFMYAIAIAFLYYQKSEAVRAELALKKSIFGGSTKYYYVLLAMVAITLSSILLEPYMMIIPKESLQTYIDMFFSGNIVLTFVIGVIFAPILEEIIFRGYLLRGLERRYGAVKGVLFTSIIFGAIHFSLVQMPSAFLISIVMSVVYLVTRYSLSTVILIHALNNLIAFSIPYFFGMPDVEKDTLMYYIDNNTIYIIVYCMSLISFIALVILGFRYAKANKLR